MTPAGRPLPQSSLTRFRRGSNQLHRSMTTSTSTNTTAIVSRRQWQEFLRTKKPQLKPSATSTTKNATDSKPWPRSVIWTGYALAVTVIPYTTVWICLTNQTSRPWVLNNVNTTVETALRQHFGTDDNDQVSYTDWLHDKQPIPRVFMGEASEKERIQQARIEQHAEKPVRVRVKLWKPAEAAATNVLAETELELPATLPATRNTLQTQCQAQNVTINMDEESVAIDFPVAKETLPEAVFEDETTSSTTATTTTTTAAAAPPIDPLRTEARVYSLWHFQPPAPEIADTDRSVMTDDDVRQQRLRHEIAVLELELKNSTVATRPIDDIVEELEQRKKELRQLQWKKWMPWK